MVGNTHSRYMIISNTIYSLEICALIFDLADLNPELLIIVEGLDYSLDISGARNRCVIHNLFFIHVMFSIYFSVEYRNGSHRDNFGKKTQKIYYNWSLKYMYNNVLCMYLGMYISDFLKISFNKKML